jgi:hypothetical protein
VFFAAPFFDDGHLKTPDDGKPLPEFDRTGSQAVSALPEAPGVAIILS